MTQITFTTKENKTIVTNTYKDLYNELVKNNVIESFHIEDSITFSELIYYIVVDNEEQFKEAFALSGYPEWNEYLKVIEPKITEKQYQQIIEVAINKKASQK